MLTDYWSGHLDPANRKAVEEHLKQCESCRSELRLMQLLAGDVATQPFSPESNHPNQELLTQYYTDRTKLDKMTRLSIEDHLKTCDMCSYDLRFLEDLERELIRSVAEEQQPVPNWRLPFRRMVSFALKPAVAYIAVLLMAYPSVSWVVDSWRGESGTEKQLISPVVELHQGIRAAESHPIVLRSPECNFVALDIPHYHDLIHYRYDFRLMNLEEERVLAVSMLPFSEDDQFTVMVQVIGLPDGGYTVEMLETSLTDSLETTSILYPFLLKTK